MARNDNTRSNFLPCVCVCVCGCVQDVSRLLKETKKLKAELAEQEKAKAQQQQQLEFFQKSSTQKVRVEAGVRVCDRNRERMYLVYTSSAITD